ncbi:MAG: hypothetical protein RBT80_09280 [Candidatus Vecturithrix sp.]|nr:hypothetical protein [Candidatus Vecturithrix sp.]
MEKAEIRKLLHPILWDYDIDPYHLFQVAIGCKERVGSFTQQTALIRMLERLSWYDLIRLFGLEELTRLLTPDLIAQLRFPELRERYELVRKVLHGEPVSFSGWSPEYRQKIRRTLLSHRWYRTQPGVF